MGQANPRFPLGVKALLVQLNGVIARAQVWQVRWHLPRVGPSKLDCMLPKGLSFFPSRTRAQSLCDLGALKMCFCPHSMCLTQ